ncbi:hypothetical protein GW17_00050191 [Ensete ventricosum]|nr:hypothetical protein GW17_00050191 [Ensete ventricosum]
MLRHATERFASLAYGSKIVGARFYIAPDASIPVDRSPRDFHGHGSHTASTVAGREVKKASLYGIAKGTARGGAPAARIAVYKICWSDGCDSHYILAAFDDAIADGVDIISMSLGGSFAIDYFEDVLAIGSFHAVAKGILTSASAAVSSGAKGAITVISELDSTRSYSLPAVGISESQEKIIRNYIERARQPDISAPGTEILATWSPKGLVSLYVNDTRSVKYNILSGTSMACPHATAVAASVKSFHPGWSPAAVMSALMTTGNRRSLPSHSSPEAELAYGAGQLNPKRATSPGLVYDATARDYVNMLCEQGYSTRLIGLVTGDTDSSCHKNVNVTTVDMNYPTMTRYVAQGKEFQAEFWRTVTNVGNPNSTYRAKVASASGLHIQVNPRKLRFRELNEKRSFVVRVAGKPLSLNSVASASIVWSDRKHESRQ